MVLVAQKAMFGILYPPMHYTFYRIDMNAEQQHIHYYYWRHVRKAHIWTVGKPYICKYTINIKYWLLNNRSVTLTSSMNLQTQHISFHVIHSQSHAIWHTTHIRSQAHSEQCTTHTQHTVCTTHASTHMAYLFVYNIQFLLYRFASLFINIFILTDMLPQHQVNIIK